MIPDNAAILLFLKRKLHPLVFSIGYSETPIDEFLPDIEVVHCECCGWIADIVDVDLEQCRRLCTGCLDLLDAGLIGVAKKAYEEMLRRKMEKERNEWRNEARAAVRLEILQLDRKYGYLKDIIPIDGD